MSLAASLASQQGMSLPAGGKAERVDKVQLDGLVVLKILKHARENPFDNVSGPLLGTLLLSALYLFISLFYFYFFSLYLSLLAVTRL